MNLEAIPFTPEGFDDLQHELIDLKKIQRPDVIKAIAEARAHGDLKENAEYHAARERQAFIEARIADLEDKLSRAQVINPKSQTPSVVRFGAWVTLSDEDTGVEKKYRIVGDLEADISKNLLSLSSPMAKALMGKQEDDVIEIKAPKGAKEYVVLKIEY